MTTKPERVEFGDSAQDERRMRALLSERVASSAFGLLQSKRQLISCGTGTFSHKTTCPNPAHKGGRETTPSFYVSAQTGQFYCFGCSVYGNSFDLISMLGGDEGAAMAAAMNAGPIEIPVGPPPHEVAHRAARELVKTTRTWMLTRIGCQTWDSDFAWAQSYYRKIDAALRATSEHDTPQQAYGRFLTLKGELKRKTQ